MKRKTKQFVKKLKTWLVDPIFIIGGIASFFIGIVFGLQIVSIDVQGSALLSQVAPIQLDPSPYGNKARLSSVSSSPHSSPLPPPSAPNASTADKQAIDASIEKIKTATSSNAGASQPASSSAVQQGASGSEDSAISTSSASASFSAVAIQATARCALAKQKDASLVCDRSKAQFKHLPTERSASGVSATSPTPEESKQKTAQGNGGSLVASPTKEEICKLSESEIKAKTKDEIKKIQSIVGTAVDGIWGSKSKAAVMQRCGSLLAEPLAPAPAQATSQAPAALTNGDLPTSLSPQRGMTADEQALRSTSKAFSDQCSTLSTHRTGLKIDILNLKRRITAECSGFIGGATCPLYEEIDEKENKLKDIDDRYAADCE